MQNLSCRFVLCSLIGVAENSLISRKRSLRKVLHADEPVATIRVSLLQECLDFFDGHRCRAEEFRVTNQVPRIKRGAQWQHKACPGFTIGTSGALKVGGGEELASRPNNRCHTALGQPKTTRGPAGTLILRPVQSACSVSTHPEGAIPGSMDDRGRCFFVRHRGCGGHRDHASNRNNRNRQARKGKLQPLIHISQSKQNAQNPRDFS